MEWQRCSPNPQSVRTLWGFPAQPVHQRDTSTTGPCQFSDRQKLSSQSQNARQRLPLRSRLGALSSAEWTYLLGCCASCGRASWRWSARFSQDRRRDTQRSDPQPHLAVADDRRPAGSTSEHQSPMLRVPTGGRAVKRLFVSASRVVRRGRSTSDHRRPSTSPRRWSLTMAPAAAGS